MSPRTWGAVATWAVLSCGGCASMADVESARGEGTVLVQRAPCDAARAASEQVLRLEGADAVEQRDGVLLATFGLDALSYGSLAGVWFADVAGAPTVCSVTVVTKRRAQWAFTTALTESTFHEHLARALAGRASAASPAPEGAPTQDDVAPPPAAPAAPPP